MTGEDKDEGAEKLRSGQGIAIWKFSVGMAAKVAGGMAGVGTTAVTANPFIGAAVGTSLAHSLEKVGTYLVDTRLGPRQAARVGRAIAVAATRMDERVSSGQTLRADEFTRPDHTGRSAADETIEAALLAAMNSAEEKKIDFIAALMTSIGFNNEISPADAQLLIETAHNIRFRAFVVMKIASQIKSYGWPARGGEDLPGPPEKYHPLMSQIFDMTQRGIVEMRSAPDDINLYAILGPDEIDPTKLHLSPFGWMLFNGMELSRLSDDDDTYIRTVADLAELSGYGKGTPRVDARIDDGQF
ncbi:hypothetical protein [Methylobacterium sp. 391_Methyba4]|uniref:hypothetical protein n=1 Tax=Methylobacterium sp. 391_Methyba4 TaxID=3038924 RepID=UPI00241D7DB9|nr:hypothetical protein [Methylobacterium sp. 391_Methyba4]WFS07612.1 hypothetical protein P9K36_30405 [Methylobacterium sp. 391_Methyba4]